MDFAAPKRRRAVEPTLPMINVVFLLLIFFLISAQIVTPPPVDVAPPLGEGTAAHNTMTLHIAADGTLAYDATRGEAVWTALADIDAPEEATLLIRADATVPAADLARVLARTATLGIGTAKLATQTP